MTPKEFPEAYITIAKDQPEYVPIPAWKQPNDPQGRTIICWQLTWRERLRLLFKGELWHHILTFNQPLQPIVMETVNPFTQPKK